MENEVTRSIRDLYVEKGASERMRQRGAVLKFNIVSSVLSPILSSLNSGMAMSGTFGRLPGRGVWSLC